MDLKPPKSILALCTVASSAGLIAGLGATALSVRELAMGNTVAQVWFFLGSQVLMIVCSHFESTRPIAVLMSADGQVGH